VTRCNPIAQWWGTAQNRQSLSGLATRELVYGPVLAPDGGRAHPEPDGNPDYPKGISNQSSAVSGLLAGDLRLGMANTLRIRDCISNWRRPP